MTDQEQPAVPDLEMPDDVSAQWDPETGVVVVSKQLGQTVTLSPREIRDIAAWVEEHHLD